MLIFFVNVSMFGLYKSAIVRLVKVGFFAIRCPFSNLKISLWKMLVLSLSSIVQEMWTYGASFRLTFSV